LHVPDEPFVFIGYRAIGKALGGKSPKAAGEYVRAGLIPTFQWGNTQLRAATPEMIREAVARIAAGDIPAPPKPDPDIPLGARKCVECGGAFFHTRTGRPPLRCPDCRGARS
jgi:hypothetical protein